MTKYEPEKAIRMVKKALEFLSSKYPNSYFGATTISHAAYGFSEKYHYGVDSRGVFMSNNFSIFDEKNIRRILESKLADLVTTVSVQAIVHTFIPKMAWQKAVRTNKAPQTREIKMYRMRHEM